MQFVEMKCPSCGAEIKIDRTRKEAYCESCGTKLFVEDIQSTNQLGQPVADASLVDLLKNVAPLYSEKASMDSQIKEKEDSIKLYQSKANSIKLPFYNVEYLNIYLIATVVCGGLTLIGFTNAYMFLLCGALTVGAVYMYLNTKKKQAVMQEIVKNQSDISDLKKASDDVDRKLSEYAIDAIPQQYRCSDAIDYFCEVLGNQRANTMQQAINLYEEDKRNKKNIEIQEAQLKSIEELTKQNAQMKNQLNAQSQMNAKIMNQLKKKKR